MDADQPPPLDSTGFPAVCCGAGRCSACPVVMIRAVFIEPETGLPMSLDEIARALGSE